MQVRRHGFAKVILGGGEAALAAALTSTSAPGTPGDQTSNGHGVAVVSTLSPRELANGGFEPDPWSALSPEEVATTPWYVADRQDPPGLDRCLEAAASAAARGLAFLEPLGIELPERENGRNPGLHSGFWPQVSAQMFDRATEDGLTILPGTRVTDVVLEATPAGRAVTGLVCVDLATGDIDVVATRCVVLATSGFVRMFRSSITSRHTTGEGLAALARAGVAPRSMHELVIHPLGVDSGHVLSPNALTAGAVLSGKHGVVRVDDAEDLGVELLRRMNRGDGIGPRSDYLLLDMTGMSRDALAETLGPLEGVIRSRTGVDPFEAPIPVRPSPSYCRGGAPTDADGRVLDGNNNPIGGLFACDEAALAEDLGIVTLGPNAYLARVARGARVGAAASNERDVAAQEVDCTEIVERRRDLLARFALTEVAALDEWTAELHTVMTEELLAGATANGVLRVRDALARFDEQMNSSSATANPVDGLDAILEFEDLLTLSRAMADAAEKQLPVPL